MDRCWCLRLRGAIELETGNVGDEEAMRDSIYENEAVQSTIEKQSYGVTRKSTATIEIHSSHSHGESQNDSMIAQRSELCLKR